MGGAHGVSEPTVLPRLLLWQLALATLLLILEADILICHLSSACKELPKVDQLEGQ